MTPDEFEAYMERFGRRLTVFVVGLTVILFLIYVACHPPNEPQLSEPTYELGATPTSDTLPPLTVQVGFCA